jgi:hypothetical protein
MCGVDDESFNVDDYCLAHMESAGNRPHYFTMSVPLIVG